MVHPDISWASGCLEHLLSPKFISDLLTPHITNVRLLSLPENIDVFFHHLTNNREGWWGTKVSQDWVMCPPLIEPCDSLALEEWHRVSGAWQKAVIDVPGYQLSTPSACSSVGITVPYMCHGITLLFSFLISSLTVSEVHRCPSYWIKSR